MPHTARCSHEQRRLQAVDILATDPVPTYTALDQHRTKIITDALESLKVTTLADLNAINAEHASSLSDIRDAKKAYSKGRKDLAFIKAAAHPSATKPRKLLSKSKPKPPKDKIDSWARMGITVPQTASFRMERERAAAEAEAEAEAAAMARTMTTMTKVGSRRLMWERLKGRFSDERVGFGSLWRGREKELGEEFGERRKGVVQEYEEMRKPIIAKLPGCVPTGMGAEEVLERVSGRDVESESRVLRMRARKDRCRDRVRTVMSRMDSTYE